MQIAHQIDRQSRKTTSPHPRIAIAAELRYFTHRQPAALGLAAVAQGPEAEFLHPTSRPPLPGAAPLAGGHEADCPGPTSRAPLPDLVLLVVRGRSPDIFASMVSGELRRVR